MDVDPYAYAICKWKHWRGQAAERTEQIAELRRALGRKQRTLDEIRDVTDTDCVDDAHLAHVLGITETALNTAVANAARYHDALQRIVQHPALQGGVSEHVAVRIAQEAMNDAER